MIQYGAFVFLFILTLSACSINRGGSINSDDFHSETTTGIYAVSASECDLMKRSRVLQSDSPILCNRLKKVVFYFYPFPADLSSQIVDKPWLNVADIAPLVESMPAPMMGTVVVLDVVADQVLLIFNALYQFKFPLDMAIPVEYLSDKEKRKGDINNSYSFDSRLITHGSVWSDHAYGVAIDINPLQNPYLYVDEFDRFSILPKSADRHYLNRGQYRPGKVTRVGMAEDVVTLFAKQGFIVWGGDWNTPIDYMHFQVGSRTFIEHLVSLPTEEAKSLFHRYVDSMNKCFLEGEKEYGIHNGGLLRKFCVEKITTEFEIQ
ncbi:M15 family metallopeptidase [Shewanella surugensis]|uniref:M15 family metallopeptidase n=1 Tax=Shewanella surugensis TaxID=212020 RepID=A0ABT0LGT2_9GAMM|nr:M15 family metallopeptidase [Shewanella surugensis]MCL1126911.1 M15 family metallopeptidase [Shewanella surugensis]